ncbi:CTP--molybdopterin cytidylyltransferase [Pseudomonas abyssi]|jgi:molybdenum cofactor cytidylyltransferase|uniref:CTP--molybdopterin cytidylyltransferase n=2 Tax=Pseudomonas abyssi TaxID=170540 RepID=A0A2A3MID2_9PSED|nr:nucleotidyltransferase family protein [Pseudomonadales bacterium]PBK04578.1 CTP--molybdopterin cytidylyltransferase [Pseudomonas abyssi]|tara:strand:+ start:41317 stop:41880 length:564 start_codon:yes stop_codon:yes gene_type:complete
MLAAGSSQRFGSDKRRAPLASGQSLLQTAVERALSAFGQLTLVLREGDDPLALGVPEGVDVLFNPHSAQGMASSLVLGVQHLQQGGAASVAVLLADMPCLQDSTLQALIAASDSSLIVQPHWQGQAGHPVLFGRRFWPQLLALQGDVGARAVVRAHADCVKVLTVADAGVCLDVDEPAVLATLTPSI